MASDPGGSGPGALIIGGDFQGLGLLRSLGENGVPVFLLEHEPSIGRFSRFARRRARDYRLRSPERFLSSLLDLERREGLTGWVIFPTDDDTVRLLSQNRHALEGHYRNPVPSWEVVRRFYFKDEGNRLASSLGIPTPATYPFQGLDDLLAQDLRFPLVLKPVNKEVYYVRTRKKAVRADDRESLAREFKSMAALIDPSEIIAQEMILGGPKNLYSYATFFDGERSVQGMSAVRLRQHPMDFGKATTFAVSVREPELERLSVLLLKAMGFYGLAEVEFMRDERDGKFRFIEVNGRPWGWHTLAKAAGVNLPLALHRHMTGREVEVATGVAGVKWIRSITDLPTVAREIAGGRMKFGEYLSSLRGKKEFAVFSLRDPLPFFVEYLMIPYLWWKRGF